MKQTVKYLILLTIIISGLTNSVLSQNENNLIHEMHYSSYNQNMWGPDSAYNIDIEHSLFDVEIDESWGFSQISELFGQQFGVGANIGIYALLRSAFNAHGFNTGSFSLDYPIAVTMDFPEDFMFNYGEPTTIYSSYEVTEGWNLETSFPPVGVITLDLEYEFNPFMNILVCVFSCDTIHLIPSSVSVPHTLDTLFHLDSETPYAVFPCYVGDEFTFCHEYDDTIDVDFTDLVGFNFEAHVTLPNVITEDYIQEGTNCLIAQGEDPYMNVNLDVIGFLHVMAGFIPPPEGPQIQDAIGFLNDSLAYPISTPLGDIIFVIEYSLLSVDFVITNTLHQDIYFCPTIWATLDFPVEMFYSVTDPTNGDIEVSSGFNDTITFAVGNNLIIHYPCHDWDSMYVGCQYNIQPTIRNHTWDSIAFSFVIEALSANITIVTPFKSTIAPAIMPEFTLPIEDPFSPKAPAIAYLGYNIDTEEAKDIGPLEIGPLFDWTVNLGYVPATWFDQTWELMHFEEDIVFDGTYIKPRAKSEINSLLYTNIGDYCYGQDYGYVCAQALNGLPPYDFQWSTGHTTLNLFTDTDSIYTTPGYYTVTVTDANNCETYASIDVNVNPTLLHSLTAIDIECNGFFTGSIQTEINGGTPPYFFEWSNGSIQQSPNNLAAGWYYVTISDFANCSVTDSIFINQPASPLTIFVETTHIPCYGTDYGSINITLSGATPPYSIEWSSGQTYQNLNNLTAGIYTISVTDANNCLWTKNIEIFEPDMLITNINSNNIPCFGLNNGSLNVETTGGTPPYTYHWFHDLNYDSPILTNMHPGYYFVSVTDANGCADTASATISQPDELILDFNIHNVSCKGGHDAYIIVSTWGGVPPYSLVWSNGYYSDSIGNLPIGDYTITVTDNNACKTIETITITEPAQSLNSDFIQINNVSCFGFSDANANVTPNGGTAPYQVVWEDTVVQEEFAGYDMPANIYYNITVTDSKNCVYFDSIKFTQPPLLTLTGSTNPVNCGVSAGNGTVDAQGGTPPYLYLWSNDETSRIANNLFVGEVFVIVTDNHLCVDTLYLNVDKTGKIFGTYEITQENLCFKDSIATAIAYLPEGIDPKTYLWSNGQTGEVAVNLHAGKHHVFAADKYNCTDTIEVLITQPDSIKPNAIITEPSCSNVYDGAIEVAPTGGTPDYKYLWDNGANTAKISDIREGSYMLTITDANNCSFIYYINLPEAEYCITVYNTITPNNDGVNDTWIVENIEYFPFNKVWIFNRLGNEVFYAENYQNNWGGTYKGKDLPEATYYYIIDLGTGKDPIKGHVTIIR